MLSSKFPLQSLRVFEACARHQSFTRAAGELSITTTAVSQRIRALEEWLGVRLFRRHGPQLTLTEEGRRLGDEVRRALRSLNDAVEDCRSTQPRLRVTCTPTFANRWLIPRLPLFERLSSQCIDFDISTEERSSAEFDIAIRSGRVAHPQANAAALLPVLGTPMLAPALCASLTGDPASLFAMPLLRDERWPAWFKMAGISAPKPFFSSADYPTQDAAAIAAMSGAGVALLSPVLFADELSRGALVAPFEQTLAGPEQYWLLWHEQAPALSFVRWIKSECAALRPLWRDDEVPFK